MKRLLIFSICILLSGSLSACKGDQEAANENRNKGIVQEKGTDKQDSMEEDSGGGKKVADVGKPEKDFVEHEYVIKDNLLPNGSEVTFEDVSYKILETEITKEYGNRNLDNLNDLSMEGTDKRGNLLGNEKYVFLKIRFTNSSDKEKEISRNYGIITAIKKDNEIIPAGVDAVYSDQIWNEGEESEGYHYVLKPGESMESEMGYLLQETYVQGELYYMIGYTSELGNIDNKFIKLEDTK